MSKNQPVLYPLLFTPVYKDNPWGGEKIIHRYHRDAPAGIYAESWEISAHPDGMGVVANGALAGRTLAEAVHMYGSALLGKRVGDGPFPLLIKLIDAREKLSVQVHPNDATAAAYGGEPKTEMWYLLDADPGARVFAGLAPGTGPARFREAIADSVFDQVLTSIPVQAGDAVFIPGGRVHAIDCGCLILEVQQSSNTTYRIYDWGRVGNDGRPRELHIEQAEQVIRWDDTDDAKVAPRETGQGDYGSTWEIYTSPYFRMERMLLHGPLRVSGTPETFQALFCAEGRAVLHWDGGELPLPAGTSCLVPASLSGYELVPESGPATLLKITVP